MRNWCAGGFGGMHRGHKWRKWWGHEATFLTLNIWKTERWFMCRLEVDHVLSLNMVYCGLCKCKGLSTLATLLPFSATNCCQKRQQFVADLLPFFATICFVFGNNLLQVWTGLNETVTDQGRHTVYGIWCRPELTVAQRVYVDRHTVHSAHGFSERRTMNAATLDLKISNALYVLQMHASSGL